MLANWCRGFGARVGVPSVLGCCGGASSPLPFPFFPSLSCLLRGGVVFFHYCYIPSLCTGPPNGLGSQGARNIFVGLTIPSTLALVFTYYAWLCSSIIFRLLLFTL